MGQMPCAVKQPTVFWSLAGRQAGQNFVFGVFGVFEFLEP